MKVSTRSEYAAKAVLFLALQGAINDSSHPAQIPSIAQYCNIPVKYLEQILVVLRNHKILGSRRGVSGGYYLLRAPSEITVAELVMLMDGNTGIGSGLTSLPSDPLSKVLHILWHEVDDAIVSTLERTTFADLRDQVAKLQAETNPADLMFYI
jgi:Rrf2 family protein